MNTTAPAGIAKEARKSSAEPPRRFRPVSHALLEKIRLHKQLYALALLFFLAASIGLIIKPSDVSIPSLGASAPGPEIDITASRDGVKIFNIVSVLNEGGDPSLPPESYSIVGAVRVPHGKAASVRLDINTTGKVALQGGDWRLKSNVPDGIRFERTFNQGIHELKLQVLLTNCNCMTYRSPYLQASTADVQSALLPVSLPAPKPGEALVPAAIKPKPGPPWPVALSFQRSEVDFNAPVTPSDLSTVTADPPTVTARPGVSAWIWPDSPDGYVVAVDSGASANRDMHLFWAGLIFGIGGSAFIGAIQALFSRKERRRTRKERLLPPEEGIWTGRADLYARINLAMRSYIEHLPTEPDGSPVKAADVTELAQLLSEADVLASKSLAHLLHKFVYDAPDKDTQLELWNTFRNVARAELNVDRLSDPPTGNAQGR